MSEHTPTPWIRDEYPDSLKDSHVLRGSDGKYVCHLPEVAMASCQAEADEEFARVKANARYIVKSVNNHERLLEALRNVLDYSNRGDVVPRDREKFDAAYEDGYKLLKELEGSDGE